MVLGLPFLPSPPPKPVNFRFWLDEVLWSQGEVAVELIDEVLRDAGLFPQIIQGDKGCQLHHTNTPCEMLVLVTLDTIHCHYVLPFTFKAHKYQMALTRSIA
jgi:hypothetical protein